MEKAFAKAEELTATVREYVQNGMDSVKLHAADKGSAWIAQMVVILLTSIVLFLAIGFLGVAIALLTGQLAGHLWIGFVISALLFVCIAGVIWVRREKMIRVPLVNYLLQQFTSPYEEDQES